MQDPELLLSEFLKNGKKQGLDESLLREVLDHLMANQFYPAGERGNIRSELLRILKTHLKGD
tara:strand:+ start:758 stop:943 length:186 start_codon:yes stop_codon:yes gene_type:complete